MTEIAYLDNSATTQPSEGVIAAIEQSMRKGYFNPSSLYAPAIEAERALSDCRAEIAGALGVKPEGVLFTSGGTEANNLAILGAVEAMRGARYILSTAAEHPSVLEPLRALEAAGHRVELLGVDSKGALDWARFEAALEQQPSLISFMQVNNETGAVNDIGRMAAAVREKAPGALIHVDGVQGFLRLPIDGRQIDLYSLSAHKIHGPKGVGALYVRPGVKLKPRQMGGGQEGALRSGTENTPGIAGLLQAVRELRAIPDLSASLMAKKRRLYELLKAAVPTAELNGPDLEAGTPHILNVSFPPVGGEVMLHALEREGVFVSTGAACSSKKRRVSAVLAAMNLRRDLLDSALRFSLSPHTPESALDAAAEQVGRQYQILKRYGRR